MQTILCPRCGGKGRLPAPSAQAKEFKEKIKSSGFSLRQIAGQMGYSAAYVSDLCYNRRNVSPELVQMLKDSIRSLKQTPRTPNYAKKTK